MKNLFVKLAVIFLLSGLIAGCSSGAKERIKERLIQIKFVAGKAIVTGCNASETAEVYIEVVRPYLSDDPKVELAEMAYEAAGPVVDEICSRVHASMGPKVN